jgi:hypothetical protein
MVLLIGVASMSSNGRIFSLDSLNGHKDTFKALRDELKKLSDNCKGLCNEADKLDIDD